MDTSPSLLEALRNESDGDSWNKLVELYLPLIQGWLRRLGASDADRDDVAQEVLAIVVRKMPEFQRQRPGAFRSWLRTITANCLRDHWRRGKRRPAVIGGSDFLNVVEQLQDPDSGISKTWDREHDEYLTRHLLKRVRPAFSDQTWRAFEKYALDGQSADQVAAELGVTTNTVFIAKSRVMASLRRYGEGLIDYE